MRRRSLPFLLFSALALVGVSVGSASYGSLWRSAIEVPGTATLDSSGHVDTSLVSCAAGVCTAGGSYGDSSGHRQPFVVRETSSGWGAAQTVPGIAALTNSDAWLDSLSCRSGANCAAVGTYTDGSGHEQPFVVDERRGVWGRAAEVPGVAGLGSGDLAIVDDVSCSAAGECVAGGYYGVGVNQSQAFVVSESKSVWGQAQHLPGVAALNTGGNGSVNSVSCAAAGECAAAGQYMDASGNFHAFVASEGRGVWRRAVGVRGSANPASGGYATVVSVSCSAAGECAAGGSDNGRAFVVSEKGGVWGREVILPGTAALNTGGQAGTNSVSCSAPGACAAVGSYRDASGNQEVFVVNERGGVWGHAVEVPGTALLNVGGQAAVGLVSCVAPGRCAAGGVYSDWLGGGHGQAFLVTETGGVWGRAVEVPGTAALNSGGDAWVYPVSCDRAGHCAAGGSYTDGSGHTHAYVVSSK